VGSNPTFGIFLSGSLPPINPMFSQANQQIKNLAAFLKTGADSIWQES
jgi:hypothetical protein